MSTSEALDQIRGRVLAGYPLLFLKTWEEERWEEGLATLAMELERGLVLWSLTQGAQPAAGEDNATDPLKFLKLIARYPQEHLFLLKDFHPYLADPRVKRILRDLTGQLAAEKKTLLFMAPEFEIPIELQKDAVLLEMPLPGLEEIRQEWHGVQEKLEQAGTPLECSPQEEEKLLKAVLGLTTKEARKALMKAVQGQERVTDEVFAALVSEKRHLIQGSDLLEFYELDEGVGDVGGLQGLKEWLQQRSQAFSIEAQEQGLPAPKGMLLLGVQGCGKSLTARATARLLSFPLVRLDIANLLGAERGSSESNMRSVLQLMETIAPAVLWLDEIEKGFAGLEGNNADATMNRIFGKFLTWMEERRAPVFVVATANSVEQLPPELLRRGRFDELFFVDLPNYEERKHIFHIHLTKRGWNPEKYNLGEFASATESFSGAEIEQIVISAMLDAYTHGQVLREEDIYNAKEQTVPLSRTMEEKIFNLREWARGRCRQATIDSRVVQMLEEEDRITGVVEKLELPQKNATEWISLAEFGQIKSALVSYVTGRDQITIPNIQEAFAEYMETRGDQGLALKSDPNVVLWVGLSEDLAKVLANLIANRRLYVCPARPEIFKSKGYDCGLPLLEQLETERAERPLWLPTYLANFPPPGANARLERVARMALRK